MIVFTILAVGLGLLAGLLAGVCMIVGAAWFFAGLVLALLRIRAERLATRRFVTMLAAARAITVPPGGPR